MTIRIYDSIGNLVNAVTYDNDNGWPENIIDTGS